MGNLLTVAELAEYLRLTKRTIYRLLKKGDISAVKVGHKWRFDEEVIAKWLHPDTGGGKKRILVIDDDPVTGLLFKQALGDSGHTVVTADTCAEALKYVEQLKFDLIFLDLRISTFNSDEILRHIRDIKLDASITVITGYPDSESMNRALAYGPLNIIKKPFSTEDIVAFVGS